MCAKIQTYWIAYLHILLNQIRRDNSLRAPEFFQKIVGSGFFQRDGQVELDASGSVTEIENRFAAELNGLLPVAVEAEQFHQIHRVTQITPAKRQIGRASCRERV